MWPINVTELLRRKMPDIYLTISALLFTIGFTIIVIRRNIIIVLMGVELMLNAANLNFIAYEGTISNQVDGNIMALFIMVLAVTEAAVALALVIKIVSAFQTSEVDEINQLKG